MVSGYQKISIYRKYTDKYILKNKYILKKTDRQTDM